MNGCMDMQLYQEINTLPKFQQQEGNPMREEIQKW